MDTINTKSGVQLCTESPDQRKVQYLHNPPRPPRNNPSGSLKLKLETRNSVLHLPT